MTKLSIVIRLVATAAAGIGFLSAQRDVPMDAGIVARRGKPAGSWPASSCWRSTSTAASA